MATITKSGLATRPDRRFGINHKYITKTLTPYNYRWYAIVRDSCYLYMNKIKKSENGKTTIEYRTYGWCWRDGKEWTLDYPDLHYALDDLNSLDDGFEGIYPPESETPWVVRSFPGWHHLLSKSFDEPYAYQITGIEKEEEE